MSDMNFKKLKENLNNHTEDIILEEMEDLLNKDKFADVCTCEQCLLDMASYSLNRIPAKYIASHTGNLHAKLAEFEQQFRVDIITVVTQAIRVVSKNPRH
ncbi:MAG: late competence development ComFB family protein [Bacillota bacterium]